MLSLIGILTVVQYKWSHCSELLHICKCLKNAVRMGNVASSHACSLSSLAEPDPPLLAEVPYLRQQGWVWLRGTTLSRSNCRGGARRERAWYTLFAYALILHKYGVIRKL